MRAAVVGCGIGGLASAIALARRGVEVTVFEAFEHPRPLGSGLLLQPSGLAALRSLGLEDAIRAAGARVDRLEGRDLKGRLVLDLDYGYWRVGGHGVGVHRAVLFNHLLAAAQASGAAFVLGARIEAVETPARPTLIDHSGRSHGPFEVAVIADGAASGLRRSLRPAARSPVYPRGAMWANCPDPEGAFNGALRQVYHRAEVMIGVLPLGLGPTLEEGPLVSLFWSLPIQTMEAFAAAPFEAWRSRVERLWPATAPLLGGLAGAHALSRAVYHDVSVGCWSRGASILIGDAAHGTSPQLGQGANLALVDAVELAEALTAPTRPIATTLNAYQRGRRRQTGLYKRASRALTPMFQSKGWFWPLIRDLFFVPASRAPGLRKLAAAILVGTARIGPTPKVSQP